MEIDWLLDYIINIRRTRGDEDVMHILHDEHEVE